MDQYSLQGRSETYPTPDSCNPPPVQVGFFLPVLIWERAQICSGPLEAPVTPHDWRLSKAQLLRSRKDAVHAPLTKDHVIRRIKKLPFMPIDRLKSLKSKWDAER